MRPVRLEVEGFMVFRQPVVVDFAGADLFALAGPTGAGKTSLIDAVTFALYGSVPRLDDRRAVAPVVSQNLTEARVRLDFSVGGTPYTAVRVVRATKAGATTREARLQQGDEVLAGNADEVGAAVVDLLGLTYEHFTTCVSLPQGQFARFLHDKPRDRQDLLVRLLDLGLYDRVASLARQRAGLASARVDVLEGQFERLAAATPAARDEAEARVATLADLAATMAGARPEIDALAERAQAARNEADRGRGHLQRLRALRAPDGVAELSERLTAVAGRREACVGAEAAAAAALAAAEEALERLPARAALDAVRRDLLERVDLEQLLKTGEQAAVDAALAVDTGREAEQQATAERDRCAAELEQLRIEHRAHALVPTLRAGEPCPVCHQPVETLPTVATPAALSDAEQAFRTAERSLKQATRSLGDACTHQARVDEKLARVRHDLDQLTTRLARATLPLPALPGDSSSSANLASSAGADGGATVAGHGDPGPADADDRAAAPPKVPVDGTGRPSARQVAVEAGAEAGPTSGRVGGGAGAGGDGSADVARTGAVDGAGEPAARQVAVEAGAGAGSASGRVGGGAGAGAGGEGSADVARTGAVDGAGEPAARQVAVEAGAGAGSASGRVGGGAGAGSGGSADAARTGAAEGEVALVEGPGAGAGERSEPQVATGHAAGAGVAARELTVERVDGAIGEVDAAETTVAGARRAHRAAREALAAVDGERERLVADETAARRAFDAARDSVAVLDPPPAERLDLAADWQGLLAWAEQRQPVLVAETDGHAATVEAAEREAGERRAALVEACRAAGVEPPAPPAWPGEAVAAEHARAEETVRRIDADLAEAERLRGEVRSATEQRQVADTLAGHLAANRFEKWLLDEAVHRLVTGASSILGELTADAYALSVDSRSGVFTVIDHTNASQARPARTLSGGETFLASLALALALADQVAELAAAGTARLESLFLDEGFGTLDPDTLDVVATALDELGARGRMVGVVTHVRELAERLPTRFEVRKAGGSATVERIDT